MKAYLCLIVTLAGVANAQNPVDEKNFNTLIAKFELLAAKAKWTEVNFYGDLFKALNDAFPANEPYVLKQEVEGYITSSQSATPLNRMNQALADYIINAGNSGQEYDDYTQALGTFKTTVSDRKNPVEKYTKSIISLRRAVLGYDTKAEIMRIFIKTDMERYSALFNILKTFMDAEKAYHDSNQEAETIASNIDEHVKLNNAAITLTTNEFVTHLDLAMAAALADEAKAKYHTIIGEIYKWHNQVRGRYGNVGTYRNFVSRLDEVFKEIIQTPSSLMEYLREPLSHIGEAFRWKYNDVNTRSILDNTFRVMRTIINDNILTAILSEAKDESKTEITNALTEFMTAVDNHETSIRTVLTAHGLNDAVFNTQNGSFETFVQAVTTFVNSYKAAIKKGADDLPKENRATKVHGAMLVDAKIRRLTVNAVTIIVNLRWNDYQKPGTDAARLTEWQEVYNAVKKIMLEFDALEVELTTYVPGNSTTDVLKPYEKMGDKVMEALGELKKLEQILRSVHPNGAFQMPAMDAPNPTHELLKQFEQLLIEGYFYEGDEHPLKVKTDMIPPESHNLTSGYSTPLSGILFATASILLMA